MGPASTPCRPWAGYTMLGPGGDHCRPAPYTPGVRLAGPSPACPGCPTPPSKPCPLPMPCHPTPWSDPTLPRPTCPPLVGAQPARRTAWGDIVGNPCPGSWCPGPDRGMLGWYRGASSNLRIVYVPRFALGCSDVSLHPRGMCSVRNLSVSPGHVPAPQLFLSPQLLSLVPPFGTISGFILS